MRDSLDSATLHHSIWPHRMAIFTTVATLPLIVFGGIVTSLRVGLVVPDWPTTFGHNMFLFPWSQMVGGVFYEHGHRLLGSTVGALTVGLSLTLWLKDDRRWLQWLGLVALAAVIAQGILGGLRVVLLRHELAIFHACLAHAFFALVASICLYTSDEWRARTASSRTIFATYGRAHRIGLLAVILIFIQLIMGAVLRHTGHGLTPHILGAIATFIVVFLLCDQATHHFPDHPPVKRSAKILRNLVLLQLVLGVFTYLVKYVSPDGPTSPRATLLATSHVVIGALMLVVSVRFTIWTRSMNISKDSDAKSASLAEQA